MCFSFCFFLVGVEGSGGAKGVGGAFNKGRIKVKGLCHIFLGDKINYLKNLFVSIRILQLTFELLTII